MVTMGLKDSSSQNETPRHLRLFENENALKILLEDLILKIRRVFILFFILNNCQIDLSVSEPFYIGSSRIGVF